MKAYDESQDLQWQLDYSDYSNVENTAWVPATIVTKLYENDELQLTATYSFSDIDINEGIADSTFNIVAPE